MGAVNWWAGVTGVSANGVLIEKGRDGLRRRHGGRRGGQHNDVGGGGMSKMGYGVGYTEEDFDVKQSGEVSWLGVSWLGWLVLFERSCSRQYVVAYDRRNDNFSIAGSSLNRSVVGQFARCDLFACSCMWSDESWSLGVVGHSCLPSRTDGLWHYVGWNIAHRCLGM